MKIGTRSVLYGAHCFFLHPFFVAWGWAKLYGFPLDPRLWLCFFVHDLGYIGKPNMDGEEGELHVFFGAMICQRLFGRKWFDLCALHSRFIARTWGREPSRLCYADKLAIVLTPGWLYIPMARASGEIHEYTDRRHHTDGGKYETENRRWKENHWTWFEDLQQFLRKWVHDNEPSGAGRRIYPRRAKSPF